MIIPKKQMQKIAEEVGETIHKNINIMDENGMIIVSTDKSRIGTLHAGAKELLDKNLPELLIEKTGEGVHNGINLPLKIENKVIGVVGITGSVDEVRVLGGVIKKMTEVLILDSYKNSRKQAIEELKRGFVLDALFGEDEGKLELEADMLKINIDNYKVVSVLDIETTLTDGNAEVRQDVIENLILRMRKEIEKIDGTIYVRMGERFVILHATDETDKLRTVMQGITKSVERSPECRAFCGIGGVGTGREGLRCSYREADQACVMAKVHKEDDVRLYDGTDVSLLLMNLSHKKREEFVNGIFRNCDPDQKKEIIQCLKSYIKNNGSISKVAEELFVHKNTLQYRLTKMKNLTGYDPRNLKEAVPLAVAIILEDLGE